MAPFSIPSAESSASQAANLKRAYAAAHDATQVWMSFEELTTIETFLEPHHVMLEYGAGGSTSWFSKFVKEYYSIEHNGDWFKQVQRRLQEEDSAQNVNMLLEEVRAGHRGWSGGGGGTAGQFREYIDAVERFNVSRFDRVLIDGRARGACAEHILPWLTNTSLVFWHDFIPRGQYHPVADRYYDKVAAIHSGQTLVVLKPKAASLALNK